MLRLRRVEMLMMVTERSQHFRYVVVVEPIEDALPVTSRLDEAVMAKKPELMRNGALFHLQARCDLGNSQFALNESPQDSQA